MPGFISDRWVVERYRHLTLLGLDLDINRPHERLKVVFAQPILCLCMMNRRTGIMTCTVCGLVLLALGFVVLLDFATSLCPQETPSGVWCSSTARPCGDAENQCDHCVACSVSHGHLTSLAPESVVASRLPATNRVRASSPTTSSDLQDHEIFHPPLPLHA